MSAGTKREAISIVAPCYNAEEAFAHLQQAL
jgi:hypothetical protein